jgi:hypothetical protein
VRQRRQAKAEYDWPASARPTLEPAPRQLGEPLFGLYPLRLFNRQIGCHLIDPGRHPISQSPFDREIGRMPRLTRCKFGRLLFGPLVGGRNLSLERFDMRFERPDDLVRQRSFIRIAGGPSPAIQPSAVVPALGRPNSRPFVVSKRLLPLATLGPLSDRLGRHVQEVRRLPVGKPLARQIVPCRLDVGPRRQGAAQQGL